MSLSSLSGQLSSLNASAAGGKNVGSTLGSSKRHDDAVGRGVAHSTTHGHTTLAATSPHFKPSVLYADSRAASDVPLTTLRENCVSCLRQLAKLTQNEAFVAPQILQSLVGVHSLSYERGLATRAENDKLDTTITNLLSLLSTAMGESSASCFTSSLHVIEYLLRRYDIHLRVNTAESLLLAALPHHEKPFFLRVLQLVDLASLPTWVFLRPMAAKGSPPPNRSLLAKRASRDNALVVHCCEMAKGAAKIHVEELGSISGNVSPLQCSPRRGISRVISFSAAVLVEALTIQTTIPTNEGSIAEPTLRCIFPFVLNACGDNSKSSNQSQYSLGVQCPDWRGFGHVLAATVSERCVLSDDVRQVLTTTLVKGSLETDRVLSRHASTQDDHVELAADNVLAVMTVLSNTTAESKSHSSYLPILVAGQHLRDVSGDTIEHRLGYDLPLATFRALSKHKWFTQALGVLHVDRGIPVAALMASVLSLATVDLLKEPTMKKQVDDSSSLILKMIREKSLGSVWTNEKINLTASFVSVLVTSFASYKGDEDVPSNSLQSARSILGALRAVNSSGCDTGIAHAVTATVSKGAKNLTSLKKKRLSLLLGLPVGNSKELETSGAAPSGGDLSSAHLLPPRVALEHPDVAVRLNAIQRAMDEVSDLGIEDEGETLEQALLRRINTEEDVYVAAAAGSALASLLKKGQNKSLGVNFADMVLVALCKWCLLMDRDTVSSMPGDKSDRKDNKRDRIRDAKLSSESPPIMTDERFELLDSVLSAAAYAVRSLIQDFGDTSMEQNEYLSLLIQGIVAHLDFQDNIDKSCEKSIETIVSSASRALQFALSSEPKAKKKSDSYSASFRSATKLFATNDLCLTVLGAACSSTSTLSIPNSGKVESSTLIEIKRRFLWVAIASLSENLEMSSSSEKSKHALDASLQILASYREGSNFDNVSDFEAGVLLKCLNLCAKDSKHAESVPNIIVSLASVPSSTAFKLVSLPAVKYFCDSVVTGKRSIVSPISVVMEASTRFGVASEAVERLLYVATDYLSSSGRAVGSACAVVPALMLSDHDEQRVRKAALQVLSTIADQVEGGEGSVENDCVVLKDICQLVSTEHGNVGMHLPLLMDGASALPKLVTKAIYVSTEPAELRECLIRRCFLTAMAYGEVSGVAEPGKQQLGWLPFGCARGGCRAAALVLKALEFAGEAAYPLSLRWRFAGKAIFRELINMNSFSTAEVSREDMAHLKPLVDSVIAMLKGVVVVDAASLDKAVSSVVISTGPNHRGRRSRSYSVGNIDGVSYVEPYPEDMYGALVQSISPPFCEKVSSNLFAKEFCDTVIRNVFTKSWGDVVFKKLSTGKRRTIASCLLSLLSKEGVVSAGPALFELPMDATDVCHMLNVVQKENEYFVGTTFLCDWIRLNASVLSQNPGLEKLIFTLFGMLGSLSSMSDTNIAEADDVDELEFTRMSALEALLWILQASIERRKTLEWKQQQLSQHVGLLVALVGAVEDASDNSSCVRPLISGKAKSTVISVLTCLCSHNPSGVVGSLLPALLTTMVSSDVESGESLCASRASHEAFMGIVPVFCKHAASAGLSLLHLLREFVFECQKVPSKRDRLLLYRNLVDAIVCIPSTDRSGAPVGSLVGLFAASEVFRSMHENISDKDVVGENGALEGIVAFGLDVLSGAPPDEQVASIDQLLQLASRSFVKLGNSGDVEMSCGAKFVENGASTGKMDVGFEDIETVALFGPTSSSRSKHLDGEYNLQRRHQVMRLTTTILTLVLESSLTEPVQKLIKNPDSAQSALCLCLWQDLLCVQAAAGDAQCASVRRLTNLEGDDIDVNRDATFEKSFWESSSRTIGEALENLQYLLPVHLFLASATSLISDNEMGEEIRAKAVRLVAERAVDAEPDSAEAALFLEILPLLTKLLERPSKTSGKEAESTMLLRQSALVAVEHLARAMCIPRDRHESLDTHTEDFFACLEKVTVILADKSSETRLKGKLSAIENASAQLFCSAALCASSLVRLLKARCLALLPKVVDPLLESLSATNISIVSVSADVVHVNDGTAKVLQLSTLRALAAVADTLPQFLLPYLGKLLSPSGLPSRAVHIYSEEQDATVKNTAKDLENALATGTPARQLMPAVYKASVDCRGQRAELHALLSILHVSVKSSSRTELISLTNWVLKTLMLAYEHEGGKEDRDLLFSTAHKVFLALVLKLSEAQLRPLYARLREWRGEFEPSKSDKAEASKRLAFWQISSMLSKELRTIFLPCLSTVVVDAVEELEFAVSKLCDTKSAEKVADGKKKRRLAFSSTEDFLDPHEIEFLRTLQPILCCLESALKADAHEGGDWARADDGERFNSLLSPLGKLLQCRVPVEFPLAAPSSASPFAHLIQGVGAEGNGNVIDCLTALASAGGNEQLWKPLNHVVLEACDYESRSEVRKAGVHCLLSLIKTLGEEYMVLLPECLPTLSELLEDSDEEIASLAQECVSLGEDLLGESLQESLR